MRLLTKNTLVSLAVAIVVFILGGFVFYVQLNHIISEEATESLLLKREQVLAYTEAHHKLPEAGLAGEAMLFTPAAKSRPEMLKDTLIYDELEHEQLPYRQLFFSVSLPGALYTAEIRKPMLESEDLEEAIFNTLLIICIVLLVLMLGVNYLFAKRTWKPFFRIIRQLESFDVEKQGAVTMERTNTIEFKALNEAVEKMTARLSADFQNLRSFTENASHEIQTPLAIIKNRLELLIQSEQHNEESMKAIQAVYEAANRLSKLNQALLLLTRIENRQFSKKEPIDLAALLEKYLLNYMEFIKAKALTLDVDIEQGVMLQSNAALMDILLGNLLGNAARHNVEKGQVRVQLSAQELTVSNTGKPLDTSPDKLFERFAKNEQSSESLGLGLAIVKKIANTEQFTISYTYHEGWHTVSLRFLT